MARISAFHSSSLRVWELRDVGECGRLRCLHDRVDTTICVHAPPQCSGCVVYGPSAMAAIQVLADISTTNMQLLLYQILQLSCLQEKTAGVSSHHPKTHNIRQ